MVKRRAGLFFLFLSVVAALITGACAKQPDDNSGQSGSPTPTLSPTPNGSPTPLGTPILPVESWTTPDGSELWLAVKMGFDGSIVNVTTRAVGCTNGIIGAGVQATTFGQYHVFRFKATGANPPLNCSTGSHHYDFDYLDMDGGCTTGCVTDEEAVDFTSGTVFGNSSPTLTNVSADFANTTGALRFTATDAQGSDSIAITEVHIYTNAGNPMFECTATATIGPSTEPAIFDTCDATAVGMAGGITAGNYQVVFIGTYAGGGQYYQGTTFTFAP